ncbi:hypothetical protein JCGZ_23248 [Jatropha curcas]|uniref:Calmodulin-binding protein n=2 Tax=Jatropha curcas TaxID=180498 RepID=A0A067JTT6_JATCU|nr:hypothetical protein JCGZ_23248 [Jatropha curcas]
MPKRPFHGDSESGSEAPGQDSKRFKNAIRDVLGLLSMEDMTNKMEPFLRRVVRDEVERTVQRFFQPSFRPSFNQAETSRVGGFLLRFINKPPSTIFTGSKIGTEDGNPIRIELLDANSNTIISSGSLSCIKIEILVLDADFGSDEREYWNESEFNSSIIREREGRRPLVTGGDLMITLRAGVGLISDIVFTDNSSWQRSRKFRLGVRPVQKTCGEIRIMEAISEAFVVKDHRGELYKKHHPPRFNDEIWRLEKIAKEGASHKKLAERGIDTVGKFLQFYAVNPAELRNMLGGGISKKTWDTIIEHANDCVVDDQLYAYYECEQTFGLLFNSVYKVIGVTFDGQIYEPLDKLAPHQKVLVENLKRQAYAHVNNFIPIDDRAIFGPSRPLTYPQTEPFQNLNPGLQQLEQPQQEQQEMLLDFNTIESGSQLQFSLAQNNHPGQVLSQMLRNSFKLMDPFSPPNYTGEAICSTSLSQWPLVTSNQQLIPEDISQFPTSTSSPANPIIFGSSNEGEVDFFSSYPRYGVHMSRTRKPKAGWCKLRAAIKFHSVRRRVAAKKPWQSLCTNFQASFCM